MAVTAPKRPYIVIVKKNIVKLIIKTKLNMKRIYTEMEGNFVTSVKIYHEDEQIDEVEQNKANEELERRLRAA